MLFSLLPVSGAKAAVSQNTDRFAVELGSDPFLMNLVELQGLLNGIDAKSHRLVGSHLRNSSWYVREVNRIGNNPDLLKKFEGALRHLDNISNYVPGQKVQCVGLVALVAGMDSRFFEISGQPISVVRELVPMDIKLPFRSDLWVDGYHLVAVKKIEQVNVGDLPMIYSTNTGHVSAVVGKKVVDGKTVLLLISANDDKDGKINIFEVDSGNFDEVFGEFPYKKIVLRNY